MQNRETREILSALVRSYIIPKIAKMDNKDELTKILNEALSAKEEFSRMLEEADLIIDAINKKFNGVN